MKTHLKITALIVFLFTLTGCEKLHSTAQVMNLKTTAKNLNQQLPTQLDENTIWTHCSTRGNKSLTYHYKVIGLTKEQINPEALISTIKPTTIETYRSHPDMKGLRKLKVDLKYDYQDENGNPLFNFTIKYTDIQ